jgi:hypothetical protein
VISFSLHADKRAGSIENIAAAIHETTDFAINEFRGWVERCVA